MSKRNYKKQIEFSQLNFDELKTKFEKWSGFPFESTKDSDLDDVLEEIQSMKYRLECEVSDYARLLDSIAKQTFPE